MRPVAYAAAAAITLSACSTAPPSSNADFAPLTPLVLDPVAGGYLTPDPNYLMSGNRGDISCNTVLNSGSTGPMYHAVRYGLDEWQDFMVSNRDVQPPTDASTREMAQFIVDFCRDTPAAVVRDTVYAFLSYRPNSLASSFGDTEVRATESTGLDPILEGARVIPAAPASPTFNPDPLALRPLRPGVVVPGTL